MIMNFQIFLAFSLTLPVSVVIAVQEYTQPVSYYQFDFNTILWLRLFNWWEKREITYYMHYMYESERPCPSVGKQSNLLTECRWFYLCVTVTARAWIMFHIYIYIGRENTPNTWQDFILLVIHVADGIYGRI